MCVCVRERERDRENGIIAKKNTRKKRRKHADVYKTVREKN